MCRDSFDNDNINRKEEFRNICRSAVKMASCEHFTVRIVTKLFKKEVKEIRKQHPQLKVEVLGENLSNQTAVSCAISKK